MSAHELLYESEGSAESALGAALKHLEELARYDARFQEPAQQLAAAKAIVEDVDAEVRDFADKINAAPGRLEEIEDRLAALDRLKRKYGQTLEEVIAFGAEAARQAGRDGEPRCAAGGVEGERGAGCGGLSRRRGAAYRKPDGGGEAAGEAG